MEKNNMNFIKSINPIRTIFFGSFLWIFLYLIAPLEIQIPVNYLSFVFIFLSLLLIILGYKISAILIPNTKDNNSYIDESHFKYILNIIIFISIFGIICKVYDKIFIRGITLGTDVFENREIATEKGGNLIAILASLTSSFAFFPVFIMWYCNLKVTFLKKITIYLIYVIQVFDLLILGSRSAVFLIIVFLVLYLRYFKILKFTFRTTLISVIVVFIVVLLMNFMFIDRMKNIGYVEDIYDLTLNYSNYNFTIAPNENIKKTIYDNLDNSLSAYSFMYVNIIQYYVHGIFEFSYVFDNYNQSNQWGSYTFFPYYRFLLKLLNEPFDISELENLSPRVGVYTSFFGPLFIDFGWMTLFFCLFLGYYIGFTYRKAISGDLGNILMYFFFFILLFFWPVVNFFAGSIGLFIFTDIIFLISIIKIYKFIVL